MSKLCKNLTMLFHVDMIYLAEQAKSDVEKSFITKSHPEQDFSSFMSKGRKYADVLPVLAQNNRVLHMARTYQPLFVLWT